MLQHAQNMPLCWKSRAFVENEYTKHYNVDIYIKKYCDRVDMSDISQKGNKTRSSVQLKRTIKRWYALKFFTLANALYQYLIEKWIRITSGICYNFYTELVATIVEEEAISSDTHLKSHTRKVSFGDTSSSNNVSF